MNNHIPAVDRTLQLLERLAESNATQAELSRELGITMSSVYRILMSLQDRQWVRKGSDGMFSLSTGVLALLRGLGDGMQVLERARRAVNALSAKYQIACKLSIRRGEEQVTDTRAEPRGPVLLTGQAGSCFPVIEGSVGAALLVGETEETLRNLVSSCKMDISETREPDLLLERVRETQLNGYVLNLNKARWNIAAFSIPLHDSQGYVIAALTIIGHGEDFEGEKRKKWEKILKQAALECEQP